MVFRGCIHSYMGDTASRQTTKRNKNFVKTQLYNSFVRGQSLINQSLLCEKSYIFSSFWKYDKNEVKKEPSLAALYTSPWLIKKYYDIYKSHDDFSNRKQ